MGNKFESGKADQNKIEMFNISSALNRLLAGESVQQVTGVSALEDVSSGPYWKKGRVLLETAGSIDAARILGETPLKDWEEMLPTITVHSKVNPYASDAIDAIDIITQEAFEQGLAAIEKATDYTNASSLVSQTAEKLKPFFIGRSAHAYVQEQLRVIPGLERFPNYYRLLSEAYKNEIEISDGEWPNIPTFCELANTSVAIWGRPAAHDAYYVKKEEDVTRSWNGYASGGYKIDQHELRRKPNGQLVVGVKRDVAADIEAKYYDGIARSAIPLRLVTGCPANIASRLGQENQDNLPESLLGAINTRIIKTLIANTIVPAA